MTRRAHGRRHEPGSPWVVCNPRSGSLGPPLFNSSPLSLRLSVVVLTVYEVFSFTCLDAFGERNRFRVTRQNSYSYRVTPYLPFLLRTSHLSSVYRFPDEIFI